MSDGEPKIKRPYDRCQSYNRRDRDHLNKGGQVLAHFHTLGRQFCETARSGVRCQCPPRLPQITIGRLAKIRSAFDWDAIDKWELVPLSNVIRRRSQNGPREIPKLFSAKS